MENRYVIYCVFRPQVYIRSLSQVPCTPEKFRTREMYSTNHPSLRTCTYHLPRFQTVPHAKKCGFLTCANMTEEEDDSES